MAGKVLLKVSVGHRLFVLVALQTTIAVLLVATAMKYLSRIAADTQHMYQSKVLSIADLGHAHRHAALLQTLTRPDAAKLGYQAPPAEIADLVQQLESFDDRYRNQWQTAEGTSSDAIRFRGDILQLGMSDVIEKEKSAIKRFEESIRSLRGENDNGSIVVTDEIRAQAPRLRYAIGDLLDINIKYAEIANQQVSNRSQRSQVVLLAIGLVGTVSTLIMGLVVRRAIAPRIRRLVTKVHRFRDLGVIEQVRLPLQAQRLGQPAALDRSSTLQVVDEVLAVGGGFARPPQPHFLDVPAVGGVATGWFVAVLDLDVVAHPADRRQRGNAGARRWDIPEEVGDGRPQPLAAPGAAVALPYLLGAAAQPALHREASVLAADVFGFGGTEDFIDMGVDVADEPPLTPWDPVAPPEGDPEADADPEGEAEQERDPGHRVALSRPARRRSGC